MEVTATHEIVSSKAASKIGGTPLHNKSGIPLEERTDLTISEVEALGLSDSYELILTPTGRRWEYETLTCPELLPGWSLNLKKIFNWPEPETAA
jgi:hypothetical protein